MSGGAWGICDRCGQRWRDRQLRTEWTGLRVCPPDYDPRPVWLDPPHIDPMEGAPIPNPRLDPDANSTNLHFTDDDNPITANDL